MTFLQLMEIVGYIGTALVIISMLMTSLTRLRIINMCGAGLSMLYAVTAAAYPVVVLNAALILIQIVQLVLMRRKGTQRKETDTCRENPSRHTIPRKETEP